MNDIVNDSMRRWGIRAMRDPMGEHINPDDSEAISLLKLRKLVVNPSRKNDLANLLMNLNIDELVINIPNDISSHTYIDELKYSGDALEIIHIHGYEPNDDIDDLLDKFNDLEQDDDDDDLDALSSSMKRSKIGGRESNRRVSTSSLLHGLQYVRNLKSLTLNIKYVYNGLKELTHCVNLQSLIIDNIQDVHSIKYILQIPIINTVYIRSGCCKIGYDDVTATTYNIAKNIEDELRLHTRLEKSTGERHRYFKQIEARSSLKHLSVDDVYKLIYWPNITCLETFKYNRRFAILNSEIAEMLLFKGVRVSSELA
jgi:hypothetical protein